MEPVEINSRNNDSSKGHTRKKRIENIEQQLKTILNNLNGDIKPRLENLENVSNPLNLGNRSIVQLEIQEEKEEKKLLKKLNDFEKRIDRLEHKSVSEALNNNKVYDEGHDSPKDRLSSFKMAWGKFTTSTSLHGIPKAVKHDSLILKLIWLVLILLSVCVGIYIIFLTFNDYYQYDVITNVERVTPLSVTFPAITICTKDFLRIQKKTYNSSFNIVKPVEEYFISFNLIDDFKYYTSEIQFKEQLFDPRNNNSQIEFFKIPKSFGICLRFNNFKTVDNKLDGLSLKINQFIPIRYNKNESSSYHTHTKFEVYVTDNYINSYMNLDPLNLDLKKQHRISIVKAETETKLGEPYNNCTEAKDKTYRQMNCIEQCINKEVKDMYNCSIPSFYKRNGLEECGGKLLNYKTVKYDFDNSESLYYENHINYIMNLTKQFDHVCEIQCPHICESVLFNTQVISTDLTKFETLFSFSISDFSTLVITQIPKMTIFTLVSNFGGTLGLFIGMSFLNMFEIFEFLIEAIIVIFSK